MINKTKSTEALIILLLILIPVALSLGIIIGRSNFSNALAGDSFSSWVSAIATAMIAILTIILAKETWNLRVIQNQQIYDLQRDAIKPNILVFLDHHSNSTGLMDIHVTNKGKGSAYKIKFDFYDRNGKKENIKNNFILEEISNLGFFVNGIACLGVEQNKQSFLFSFLGVIEKLGKEKTFSTFLKIKISHEDSQGNSYEEITDIDLSEYKGLARINDKDPLEVIAKELKEIKSAIESNGTS